MLKKNITINSRKFDGKIHRSWNADLIERKDSLLIFLGKFENEVKHKDLGVIRRGTVSYEYYWLDRWYSIFRFHEPGGNLRNFYCNINLPPKFENNILDYIDLDIDILVWSDFTFEILDEDEFEKNAKLFSYADKFVNEIHKNVSTIEKMIKSRQFPFIF